MASRTRPGSAHMSAMLLIIHLVRDGPLGLPAQAAPAACRFKRLNSASAVGWMLLMLLPLRLGEFARRC